MRQNSTMPAGRPDQTQRPRPESQPEAAAAPSRQVDPFAARSRWTSEPPPRFRPGRQGRNVKQSSPGARPFKSGGSAVPQQWRRSFCLFGKLGPRAPRGWTRGGPANFGQR
eukprot:14619049-Alexandrium_andersonii.AAC.1